MAFDFQSVLALALKLPRKDQELLRGHLTALLGLGGTPVSSVREPKSREMFILDIICDQIKLHGIDFCSPSMLKASNGYKKFQREEIEAKINEFLDQGEYNQNERRMILMLGVDLVIAGLQRNRIPVSGGSVLSSIHKLPSAINREFPGYAASGLLRMLIRSKR